MPILRELVTRFSFDVDKKSVKNYNSTISGMKKSALALGVTLGLSMGGKALFGMGVSAKQAEANLKRLSGSKFDELNAEFAKLQKSLDGVQDGAGKILRQKTFNVLASNFIKDFGSSNKQLEIFVDLLETASLQSAVTGADIEEIFTGLTQVIKSGDFGALVGVGDFDLKQQRIIEDVVAAKDPSEIGGQFGRDIRTEALLGIIENVRAEQEVQVKNTDRELLKLLVASREVKDVTERTADEAVAKLIQATDATIKATSTFFEDASKRIEADPKGEKSTFELFFGSVDDVLNKITSSRDKAVNEKQKTEKPNDEKADKQKPSADLDFIKNIKTTLDEKPREPVKKENGFLLNTMKALESIGSTITDPIFQKENKPEPEREVITNEIIRDTPRLGVQKEKETEPVQKNIEVNMSTTIHVNEATNAKEVAEIVKREDKNRIREARTQLINSEDKF